MSWSALGFLLALVGALSGLVYWLRGVLRDGVDLEMALEAVRLERERTVALEAAAENARRARMDGIREKAAAARNAADAARLLRDQTKARLP